MKFSKFFWGLDKPKSAKKKIVRKVWMKTEVFNSWIINDLNKIWSQTLIWLEKIKFWPWGSLGRGHWGSRSRWQWLKSTENHHWRNRHCRRQTQTEIVDEFRKRFCNLWKKSYSENWSKIFCKTSSELSSWPRSSSLT